MIWIILGIIVVLVLIVVGVYNGLVKSRMQTREAWSQIDVQLKRRNDLIPNLIETVKGYAKYEGDTLAKVTQLRQQVAQASSPAEQWQPVMLFHVKWQVSLRWLKTTQT